MLKNIINRIFPPPMKLEVGGWYICHTDNPWGSNWKVEIVDMKRGWIKYRTLRDGYRETYFPTDEVTEWTFRRIFDERVK